MEPNARVECPSCGIFFVVLPKEQYNAISDLGGIEAELQFTEAVVGGTAQTGDRFTIAGADRGYTCPACGERGVLPSEDELHRLAEEQRQALNDESE